MKPGGGKIKGATFERKIAAELSLWLSHGERNDIISRTESSGGRFTYVEKGRPGDLSSGHPLAYEFFQHVVLELKHWHKLDLIDFMRGVSIGETDTSGSSLYKAMIGVKKLANKLNREWMLIVKQNYRPTLLLTSPNLFPCKTLFANAFPWHVFFNMTVYCCELKDYLKNVSPDSLFWMQNKQICQIPIQPSKITNNH